MMLELLSFVYTDIVTSCINCEQVHFVQVFMVILCKPGTGADEVFVLEHCE